MYYLQTDPSNATPSSSNLCPPQFGSLLETKSTKTSAKNSNLSELFPSGKCSSLKCSKSTNVQDLQFCTLCTLYFPGLQLSLPVKE